MTTTTITPRRTADQRFAALQTANRVRVERARLKQRIKREGVALAVQVIDDPPSCAATMKVYDLLRSLPQMGSTKATRLMNTARVSMTKTVAGLSDRQADELRLRLLAKGTLATPHPFV